MKLVRKTCTNPDCGLVKDLPENTRFCPLEECGWEMTPYDFYAGKKTKEEQIMKIIGDDKTVKIGSIRIKFEKKKREIGLICPECGAERPGWRSKMWAHHERMAMTEKKKKENLKKGIRG